MAVTLTVVAGGGKLNVYAANDGSNTVIIDMIVVTVEAAGWSGHWFYREADFTFGPRIEKGMSGHILTQVHGAGPFTVHATAYYWEVDRAVQSTMVFVPEG